MGTRGVDIESMGGEERILSIVLSTSDLAKLDLSNLQLFQANADQNNNGMHINSEADPFSFFRETAGPVGLPEPVVFKSRAVMEAETSNSLPPQQSKKAASMDEMGFGSVAIETENKAARDDPMGEGSPRGCRTRRPTPMSGISRTKNHPPVPLPEPQQVAKPRIDLTSSPASKFLVQLMPWELQPSPVTPFTPAAVPFEWEEAPGKPKPRAPDRRSPRLALHLPPRLLVRPAQGLPAQCPTEEPGALYSRSGSSGSAEEKRVISIEEKRVISIERASEGDDDDNSAGCLVDCELSSPWDGHIMSADSPLKNRDTPDLHWGAKASALITMWRKNSSSKVSKIKSPPNSNKKNNKPESLSPSGEFLINREDYELWANEENRAQSLNAIIAVAMGAKTEDCNFSNGTTIPYSKNLRTIMDPEVYCSKKPKRTKRKLVLRKLRRPAQLFNSFFSAVWRGVCLRKWRLRSIGNMKQSYQALSR